MARANNSDLDAMMDDDNSEPLPSKKYAPKFKSSDYPKPDLTNPSQFRASVRNIANVHQAALPHEVQSGRDWYPKVHDAVSKGIKGTSMTHKQGSGLVAALSPNMDFDKVNIPAFGEIHKLTSGDWQAIHASHATRSFRGENAEGKAQFSRSDEASDVLKGMSLSQQSDSNLIKAHRILQGEDPEDVLPRGTAPKTNSFMSNIHDPHGSPHVTIDARAHDIAQDRMDPWTYSGRGITSADLKSSRNPTLASGKPNKRFGQKSRYEHFENAYRTASGVVGEEHPTAMQAITWTAGKRLEKSAPTKSGKPRVKGVSRQKQGYSSFL